MTTEQSIYAKQINELVKDIQMKDDRYTIAKLEREVFEKAGIISNATSNYSNVTTSVDRYRFIISKLTEFRDSIKDYSSLSTDELTKVSKNLIKNNGYMISEVSEMMGKSSNYIYTAFSRRERFALLNIYDYTKMLHKKGQKNIEKHYTLPQETIKSDENVSIAKLILNGKIYYLEDVQANKLVFGMDREDAEWFSKEPSIATEIMKGKKKTVIEFEN